MTKDTDESGPLLVTGMPRSGTTWLARLLASSPRTALPGREPMNPRGRQYALAGTLGRWARLRTPSRKQRVALRFSYRGWNPLVYGKFGRSQWTAPLPGVRLVVKDPFAMLSMPLLQQVTGAQPVLLFRHPGAMVASYRRMGWHPDLRELRPIVDDFLHEQGPTLGVTPLTAEAEEDDISAMIWFWNALYGMAVHDCERLDSHVVLSHHDVAAGGVNFCRALFDALGLHWHERVSRELVHEESATAPTDARALHNFDRPPAQVTHEWESKVTREERMRLEEETGPVLAVLTGHAFHPAAA